MTATVLTTMVCAVSMRDMLQPVLEPMDMPAAPESQDQAYQIRSLATTVNVLQSDLAYFESRVRHIPPLSH